MEAAENAHLRSVQSPAASPGSHSPIIVASESAGPFRMAGAEPQAELVAGLARAHSLMVARETGGKENKGPLASEWVFWFIIDLERTKMSPNTPVQRATNL